MINALVVRRNTQLATVQKRARAAQYVRMSTDKQRYSIENQAAVIAAYAHAHDLTIVRTYADEGESGLRIKNRPGLIQLIEDVRSGETDFGRLLVYDVSRWGRFQDIDESAHYEFVCKQAGINVAYCAEQFDNDGSMLSSIVKNLKRVMAAEYSRELSVKVHAGACRFSRLGFKVGGRPGYALERELVDQKLQSKGILKDGDRKYLITDHVRLRPAAADKVAVVRWIFQRFLQRRSETAIANELNRKDIPVKAGVAWDREMIGRVLRNENYVGNIVYNRQSSKLGEKKVNNPFDQWVRSEGSIEPIIELDVFLKAKKIIEERRVDLTETEMLTRLRKTLLKEGRLSPWVINRTVGLPCSATYMVHFGSLRNAYRLIGYKSERNFDYLDSRQVWGDLIAKLTSRVADKISREGWRIARVYSIGRQDVATPNASLSLEGAASVTFRIARWVPGEKETHSPHWRVERLRRVPAGWLVGIRLSEYNKSVLDYVLLPTQGLGRTVLRFSERSCDRRRIARFQTAEALARAIARRIGRTSSAGSRRPSRSRKSGRSKSGPR
ncbi:MULTISPECIES: recombinase family protein [unclassified Bradyrhizobium]